MKNKKIWPQKKTLLNLAKNQKTKLIANSFFLACANLAKIAGSFIRKYAKSLQKKEKFEGGCQHGKECQRLHVTHCPESKQNRACTKTDCRRGFHIKEPKYEARRTLTGGEPRKEAQTAPSFLGHPSPAANNRIEHLEAQLEKITTMVPMFQMMECFFSNLMMKNASPLLDGIKL